MKTVELFSGTKSFSKVMQKHGFLTLTYDHDGSLNPDVCCDVSNFLRDYKTKGFNIDILWASPPCTTFSVASIGRHWNSTLDGVQPKTIEAFAGIQILRETIKFISESKPVIWFIENPRGMMRKVIDKLFREQPQKMKGEKLLGIVNMEIRGQSRQIYGPI